MSAAAHQDRIDQAHRVYTDAWFRGTQEEAQRAFAVWMEACRDGETAKETYDRLIRQAEERRGTSARFAKTEGEHASKAAGRRLKAATYGSGPWADAELDEAANQDVQAASAARIRDKALIEAEAMEDEARAITRRQSFADHVVAIGRAAA